MYEVGRAFMPADARRMPLEASAIHNVTKN
jgi:hypothetical protein